MTFTGSAFERIRACPASAAMPQINLSSEWAETGITGHDALDEYVIAVAAGTPLPIALANVPDEWQGLCGALGNNVIAWGLRSEVAYAYNVATGEARHLGQRLGRQYKLETMEVACTLDLVGTDGDAVVVIDAKTGHGDVTPADRNQQLRFQALCAAKVYGKVHAKIAILRCTENGSPRWDWSHLEVWDLDEVEGDIRHSFAAVSKAMAQVQAGKVPNVTEGSHCKYCPAAPVCPAKTALIRQMADGTALDHPDFAKPLAPHQAGVAWRRLQAFKQMLRPIESAIMACLDEAGSLPLPDGKTLRKVIVPGNESLDGDVVFAVLQEMYGRDIADAGVERRATKKAIKDALKLATTKGTTSEAERQVLDEVRKRGGAERGTREKLEEVDVNG